MKLRKCDSCNIYTLKETCSKCKKETLDAHYKFVRMRVKEQETIN